MPPSHPPFESLVNNVAIANSCRGTKQMHSSHYYYYYYYYYVSLESIASDGMAWHDMTWHGPMTPIPEREAARQALLLLLLLLLL